MEYEFVGAGSGRLYRIHLAPVSDGLCSIRRLQVYDSDELVFESEDFGGSYSSADAAIAHAVAWSVLSTYTSQTKSRLI